MAQTAIQVGGTVATWRAGADLSAKQYYAVKLDANREVVLAGAGEKGIGILQNDPVENQEAAVRLFNSGGIAKAVAGGAWTLAAWLKIDSAGKLVVTTTDTDVIIGQASRAADTDDFGEFLPAFGTLAG